MEEGLRVSGAPRGGRGEVGGRGEGREPEACRAVGPGRMLELQTSAGFSSEDSGEREEVQSVADCEGS